MDGTTGLGIFTAGGVNIDNAVQNLEEEEELEDQKRRQEEIQTLLTKALDDFNYDDQSTIDSSANASIVDYSMQFKEAPIENQLEVLYNVRVKEVEALNAQVKALEKSLAECQSQNARKLMLSAAEIDNLKISLKNSQELIVEKCNDYQKLENDRTVVIKDIDTLQKYMTNLEHEKSALEYTNRNLLEQVAILEKGRGANPLSEAVLQENHNVEVSKLQHKLEISLSKIQRLEEENITLKGKLNNVIREKEDMLANKTETINKLMINVETAQEQNHELLGTVNRISIENEKLQKHCKEIENNMQLIKGFTDKTEIIKILQKELEKTKGLNDKQMKKYSELLANIKLKDAQIKLLEEHITASKTEKNEHSVQTSLLIESSSMVENLRDEIKIYEEQLLEKSIVTKSLQENLQLFEDEILNLNKKLQLSAQRDQIVEELQEKAIKLQQIITNNQSAPSEDKGTSTDPVAEQFDVYEIYKAKFEGELLEREIQLRKELQAQFEANYQKLEKRISCKACEKLLEQIKVKDQQLQLQMRENQNKGDFCQSSCELCLEMSHKLTRNMEMITRQEAQIDQYRLNQDRDRELIVKILEEWKIRFEEVEHENRVLKDRLEGAVKSYKNVKTELVMIRKSETDLMEKVQGSAKIAVKNWSRDTIRQVHLHNQKILLAKEKMENISRETDDHVKQIEHHYNKAKVEMNLLSLQELEKL